MMWATIRRKALSAGSSALSNNGIVQSLERAQPALAGSASRGYIAAIPMSEALNLGRGSKLVPEFHRGAPIYSKLLRDVVSLLKRDFRTQMWIRSFSSYSEPAVLGHISEPIVQMETDKGIAVPFIHDAAKMNFAEIEKAINTSAKTTNNGPASFAASGGVLGSVLSTPIANAPQVAKLGMASTVTSTFLPNLALFWHINNGIEEILADYVHHEMTRSLILVLMRLFLIVAAKDVFVATN